MAMMNRAESLRQIPSELGRPIDQKADGAGKDQHNQFMSARKRQLLHLLTGHTLVHVEVDVFDDGQCRILLRLCGHNA